jgi:hypothetical protein
MGCYFFYAHPGTHRHQPVFHRAVELPADSGELYLVAITGQQFHTQPGWYIMDALPADGDLIPTYIHFHIRLVRIPFTDSCPWLRPD